MVKIRPIIISVVMFFLLVLGILIWRASLLFDNLSSLLPAAETNSEFALDTDTSSTQETFNSDITVPDTAGGNTGHDETIEETIEETITRLKRDVMVTGTVTGTAGKESAMFQIERMPDRSFDINTQLMDGFIITEITQTQVTLKDQSGDEFFSLPVQSGNNNESMPAEPINSEFLPTAEPVQTSPMDSGYPSEFRPDEIRASESRQDDLSQARTNAADSVFSPESRADESGQIDSAPVDYDYPPKPRPDQIQQIETNPANPYLTSTDDLNSDLQNPEK